MGITDNSNYLLFGSLFCSQAEQTIVYTVVKFACFLSILYIIYAFLLDNLCLTAD